MLVYLDVLQHGRKKILLSEIKESKLLVMLYSVLFKTTPNLMFLQFCVSKKNLFPF